MHQQPIKTCFLPIAAGSNDLFSYHVLLKLSAKSNKAPHTPAHLLKGRSLQGMHAHHISYSSFAARRACTSHYLLSIIFTTSADPNEPNTVNKLYMFISYHLLIKTKKTQTPLRKLYIYFTPLKNCARRLCVCRMSSPSVHQTAPPTKAVKSKDAKTPMYAHKHDMHQTAPPTTSS